MFKKRDIDFTEGSITQKLFLFALPIIVGELLQNLYHSVDSLVVGNYVGDLALAAVGVCGMLSNLLIMFFNGVSVGSSIVVSKAFGRRDDAQVKKAIQHTFTFSVVIGVILSALGVVFAPQLLRITGASEELFDAALLYLRIYLFGLMFTVIYNCGAGALRAVGDAQTPFYILLAACVINIFLDWLLTGVLQWGITGVAFATVISQAFSVIAVYVCINRSQNVHCIDFVSTWREGKQNILDAMSVGVAAGLQSSLVAFSNLFVWRYINGFSTNCVAGVSVGFNIDKFVGLPCKGYGLAMTTFVGQNIGAGTYNRVKDGLKKSLVLSVSTAVVLALLVYPFAEQLAWIFDKNPDVIAYAKSMVYTLAPFYTFMGIRDILLGYLRGHGKSIGPMVVSLAGMVGVRQLYLAIAMHYRPDVQVVFNCFPLAYVATTVFLIIYALAIRKKLRASVTNH